MNSIVDSGAAFPIKEGVERSMHREGARSISLESLKHEDEDLALHELGTLTAAIGMRWYTIQKHLPHELVGSVADFDRMVGELRMHVRDLIAARIESRRDP